MSYSLINYDINTHIKLLKRTTLYNYSLYNWNFRGVDGVGLHHYRDFD